MQYTLKENNISKVILKEEERVEKKASSIEKQKRRVHYII